MVHYLVTFLVDFIVGFLALSKRGNSAAKALALTAFSLGLWSMELFLLTVVKDLSTLTVWFHLTRWGMFFIPPSLALLTWRLIGGGTSRIFFLSVVLPCFVASSLLSIANLFFFPSTLVPAIGGFLPKIDSIFYLFAVNFLWCLSGAIIFGAVRFKRATHREKQRVRWLLIILLMILIAGLASIYLVKYSFYLKLVGAVTNIVCISLLFYATVQNNLMDVRSAIGVAMARAAILAAIVWFYFYIIGLIGEKADSVGGAAVMVLFVVAVLELYPRILKWVVPGARKVLVKHGYEFEQVQEDTEKALHYAMNFPTMLEVLDHLFLKIIRVNNYKILLVRNEIKSGDDSDLERSVHPPFAFIADNHPLVSYCAHQHNLIMADEVSEDLREEMDRQRAVSCFSVVSNKKVIALVFVGPSAGLSYYRYDDIRIFEWLGPELSQVLQRLIRLEQMQDQLGEAKKTLSMLGMMSHYHHDIKAPFAIIDGVLSNDIYDRDKQKNIVLEQVERGSRLIATMASILGGKRRRRVQACALDALIKDCLFVFETSIDNVEFISGEVPKVAGDAEDLKILFINLIKNATEARRGQEDLILTVKSWMKDMRICFSIQDNGVGMSEQQLATLWEQDYSTKEFGHGIGMQAIKRIADEHGAQIEVRSEVGKGTEFVVSFPAMLILDEEKPTEITDELNLRRAASNK